MPRKKRVAFTTARGKHVSFLVKAPKKPKSAPRKKPCAQRMPAKRKPSVKVNNKSRTRKIKADTGRLLRSWISKSSSDGTHIYRGCAFIEGHIGPIVWNALPHLWLII